jgi:hypothetical protein
MGVEGHISYVRAQIPVEILNMDFRLGIEEQICLCTPKGLVK